MLCIYSFAISSKIGHDFSNIVVLKLKIPKKNLTKNVLLNSYFSMKKYSEKFNLKFRFWHYEVAKLGKVSRDAAYNQGEQLIL